MKVVSSNIWGRYYEIWICSFSRLRVGFSKLNFHKFNHDFRDNINFMCRTNDCIDDTQHFLLLCSSFVMHRRDLLTNVLALVQPFGYSSLSNKDLRQLCFMAAKISLIS